MPANDDGPPATAHRAVLEGRRACPRPAAATGLRRAAWAAALCWPAAFAAAPVQPTGGAAPALATQPPAAGLYDATLCVNAAPAPQSCGPLTAEVDGEGKLYVRISDIVYRLEPWGEKLGVSLFHGTMQIDGFFAQYRWNGRTLQFVDAEKTTRYELSLGTRRFDSP